MTIAEQLQRCNAKVMQREDKTGNMARELPRYAASSYTLSRIDLTVTNWRSL